MKLKSSVKMYGTICEHVRRLARKGRSFTPKDLTPTLTLVQARGACRWMYLSGELIRISKGSNGRIKPVKEARYKKADWKI